MQPLQGVKVLDCTKVLAGPLCTQYLSDLGADIIKVEPIAGGDDTRLWPPIREGFGAIFLSVNRNKKSIALDLKSPEGRTVIRDLIRQSDVLLESYGTGVAARSRHRLCERGRGQAGHHSLQHLGLRPHRPVEQRQPATTSSFRRSAA